MADLRKNDAFHATLDTLVKQFNENLKAQGFNMNVTRLTFDPRINDLDCRCGTESFLDRTTGEWKTRCKRCPPPRGNS
jgi:hypothetical protein